MGIFFFGLWYNYGYGLEYHSIAIDVCIVSVRLRLNDDQCLDKSVVSLNCVQDCVSWALVAVTYVECGKITWEVCSL